MYLISTLIAYIETYGFISCKVGHVEIQNATQKVLYNLIKSLVWSKKDQNRARNSLRVYVSVRKYCHNSYRRSIADTTCQDRCYRIGNCKDSFNFFIPRYPITYRLTFFKHFNCKFYHYFFANLLES